PCRRFVFCPASGLNHLTPKKPAIITYPANLSTVRVNFFAKLANPSKAAASEELRIIQALANPSRPSFF
ncbi:MAG: hypothetical protein QX196_12660, partial [Methylococcaceae bacterium]